MHDASHSKFPVVYLKTLSIPKSANYVKHCMICCYHTEAKGQMCKEIIPIFLCVALLLSFILPEIGDYTIREFIYGVQDTTAVVRGTLIVCEIIAVSNSGYGVYTIYG